MDRSDRGSTGTGVSCGTIFETDMVIEFDYIITYEGCKARTYGDPDDCYPAEDPEYDIEGIRVYEDLPQYRDKPQDIVYLDVPAWLRTIIINYLEESGDVIEQINKDFD